MSKVVLFTVDSQQLQTWLSLVARVIVPNSPLESLKTVRVKADSGARRLTLTASDNAIATVQVEVDLDIEHYAEFCLPVTNPNLYPNDKLGKWLGYISGPVEVSLQNENTLVFKAGRNKMQLSTLPVSDYIVDPLSASTDGLELEVEIFLTLLRRTVIAADSDKTGSGYMFTTGVWLAPDMRVAVATDRYTFAIAGAWQDEIAQGDGLLLPVKTCNLLRDTFAGCQTLAFDTAKMQFNGGRDNMVLRLFTATVNAKYPNAIALVKRELDVPTSGVVETQALQKALRTVTTFSPAALKYKRVGLRPVAEGLYVSAMDGEAGSAELFVPGSFSGKLQPALISGTNLQEGLKELNSTQVKLGIGDGKSTRAAIVTPVEGEDYLYLAMLMEEVS